MRPQYMSFEFNCRTSDNVELVRHTAHTSHFPHRTCTLPAPPAMNSCLLSLWAPCLIWQVLEGTFFWQIADVAAMVANTADLTGDICAHARSQFIGLIARESLKAFMQARAAR